MAYPSREQLRRFEESRLDLVRKGLILATLVLGIVALVTCFNLGGGVVIPLLLYTIAAAFLTGAYVVSERATLALSSVSQLKFDFFAELFRGAYGKAFLGAIETSPTARRLIEGAIIALGFLCLISAVLYGATASTVIMLAEAILALAIIAAIVYVAFRVGRALAWMPGMLSFVEACRTTLALIALSAAVAQGAPTGTLALLGLLTLLTLINVIVCEIAAWGHVILEYGVVGPAREIARLAGMQKLELRTPLPVRGKLRAKKVRA